MQENSSCTKVQQLLLTQQRSVSMVTLQIKSQLMNKMSTKHDFCAHWQFVSIFITVAFFIYTTCIMVRVFESAVNEFSNSAYNIAYRRGSY